MVDLLSDKQYKKTMKASKNKADALKISYKKRNTKNFRETIFLLTKSLVSFTYHGICLTIG